MLGTAIVGAALAIRGAHSYAQQAASHDVPAAQSGGTVVMLCDGKTSIEVKNLKPGQTMSRARAQAVSDELMNRWRQTHPGERWEVAQASRTGGEHLYGAGAAKQAPAAASSLAVQQGDCSRAAESSRTCCAT
jgi:hypothetical protein